ncbi:MAG: hypothetical protein ACRD2K_02300 [Terriglobales bacterium]
MPRRKSAALRMPGPVARRIMKRAAENRAFVVVPRNGVPSRVFRYAEYQKRVALPKKVKPWEKRKQKKAIPDPLGAMPLGRVHGSLRREDIYE